MVWVLERTILTELLPLLGEVIANFCWLRVPHGQRDGSLRPYSRFSRQEPLLFYLVAPQLYSRGWVDPVPDPLLFSFFFPPQKIWRCRESNPGLRICSQELWPLDHRGGRFVKKHKSTFLSKILIHPLSYATLYSLLIRTKLIPLICCKKCIRYSIFKHNA
jgi:hypothetical protein